jgi:hypothetical protein
VERLALVNEEEPALSGDAPSWVWPSRKVTEPVGVPDPDCGATDAVNVTLWPDVSCVAEAESNMVVAILVAFDTVTDTAGDVDDVKFESPE